MNDKTVFDDWPEKYDKWFQTPIGKLIRYYEGKLVLDMTEPKQGEKILDAGCGTGVFTKDLIDLGAEVVGLELSVPMLKRAGEKLSGSAFQMVPGDMTRLPFSDNYFDKAVSVTAIEFIEDACAAIEELFRVTRPGGSVIVATLNSLSPWAKRRKEAGKKGHAIFKKAFFRSPDDLLSCTPFKGEARSAIHFEKTEDPGRAKALEEKGEKEGLDTGAFLVCRWVKQ